MPNLSKNYQCLVNANDVERMEHAENVLYNLFTHGLPVRKFHKGPDKKPFQRLMLCGHGLKKAQDRAKKIEPYYKDHVDYDLNEIEEVAIFIPGSDNEYIFFRRVENESKI